MTIELAPTLGAFLDLQGNAATATPSTTEPASTLTLGMKTASGTPPPLPRPATASAIAPILTRPRRKENQTMSLAIDVTRVTHVLLADGWHEVADGSFTVAPYEFARPANTGADERDFVVLYNSSNMGTDPMGYGFTEARTSALISGPLTSVIAVRREHP